MSKHLERSFMCAAGIAYYEGIATFCPYFRFPSAWYAIAAGVGFTLLSGLCHLVAQRRAKS